ncbi:MAG: hypothetical protein D3908_15235 [Candidatus Electrothrix sp. AUS4]|nr:hypothetical protein [Candidatus Electrothrix sp. AUS4]
MILRKKNKLRKYRELKIPQTTKKISEWGAVSYKAFSKLMEKDTWDILNKGVHEQSDLPEFDRKDIEFVIQLLEELENDILSTKFTTVASTIQ